MPAPKDEHMVEVRVRQKKALWKGAFLDRCDAPEKGGTSLILTPREMELENCPFLGSSERVCTRQKATQHSRGLSLHQGSANLPIKGPTANFQVLPKVQISI